MADKRCVVCGKKGAARANGKAWLCEKHALEATELTLRSGQSVIWANRGEPQYLIMPTGVHRN